MNLNRLDNARSVLQPGHHPEVRCPGGGNLGYIYSTLGQYDKAAAETEQSQRLEPSLSAYQDFFNVWKDVDPDIPILKRAREEYAKLQ